MPDYVAAYVYRGITQLTEWQEQKRIKKWLRTLPEGTYIRIDRPQHNIINVRPLHYYKQHFAADRRVRWVISYDPPRVDGRAWRDDIAYYMRRYGYTIDLPNSIIHTLDNL